MGGNQRGGSVHAPSLDINTGAPIVKDIITFLSFLFSVELLLHSFAICLTRATMAPHARRVRPNTATIQNR